MAAIATLGFVLTLAPAAGASPEDENMRSTAFLDWNEAAGRAAVAACIAPLDDPLHESRMYATAHLAIHNALNAINPRYEQYGKTASARHGQRRPTRRLPQRHGMSWCRSSPLSRTSSPRNAAR